MRLDLAAVVFLASTAAAQTGVIRLPAIADAHVDQSQPSTNFGADVELNGFTARIF